MNGKILQQLSECIIGNLQSNSLRTKGTALLSSSFVRLNILGRIFFIIVSTLGCVRKHKTGHTSLTVSFTSAWFHRFSPRDPSDLPTQIQHLRNGTAKRNPSSSCRCYLVLRPEVSSPHTFTVCDHHHPVLSSAVDLVLDQARGSSSTCDPGRDIAAHSLHSARQVAVGSATCLLRQVDRQLYERLYRVRQCFDSLRPEVTAGSGKQQNSITQCFFMKDICVA